MKKILVILTFVILLTGCGSSNKFEGIWYTAGSDTTKVTFKSNGNCELEYIKEGDKAHCRYSFDDEKITIMIDDSKESMDYSFEEEYLLIGDTKLYRNLDDAKNAKGNDVKVVKKQQSASIPDVSGMSVYEAERVLTERGFEVDSETKKEASNTIEAGKVIRTDPAAGRERTKGTRVVIVESIGEEGSYIIEDYTGKNYIEVKTKLESSYKMQVLIEKKDSTETVDSNAIIGQSLEPGTEVKISEDNPARITLYIPDVREEYPNFAEEGWTVQEVEEFAKKYDLVLSIEYEKSDSIPKGAIIKQSRTGKIVKGTTLVITVVE